MSENENTALVRRLFEEGLNSHDADLAATMVAPGFVRYGGRGDEVRGRDAWAQLIRAVFHGMPDVQWAIEEIFAGGDRVAMRSTVTGTHTGAEWPGIPPTGNKVVVPMNSVFGVADGKIVEERSIADYLDFWQQLGVISSLEDILEQYKSKQA